MNMPEHTLPWHRWRLYFTGLLPLSVAKLFSDQVLPSAGVSGTAFQLAALTRRGVMAELVVGVMLVTLVCYYGACLLMDAVAVLILWSQQELRPWMVVVAAPASCGPWLAAAARLHAVAADAAGAVADAGASCAEVLCVAGRGG